MATVAQELNIEKIQSEIAEKMGMQLNETDKDVRASRLYERLKEEKNMFLILDDLWEELDLLKVGIPFVDVEKYGDNIGGCKILLTSRNETLLSKRMKCKEIIKVGILLKDEAWKLFERIVEVPIDSNIESVAIDIVRKCEGLPLAIATAAKALQEKDMEGWEDYLRRMKHALTRSYTGIKEVDNILRLSYDHLSLEMKRIFLLAAMLSHDPSIKEMLMYSVGLSILENVECMEEAHNGISTAVRKLKSINLFLDSSVSSRYHFTMHDVFRDVALSIASHELLHAFIVRHRRLNEWPSKNQLKDFKGIFLHECDITDLPEKVSCPDLEFFLLNNKTVDLTIPNKFFESSIKLKLLVFSKVHFSSLSSLNVLQELKTLCLHSCVLEDIVEVGGLWKLKVLSLAYSEIEELPIELAELASLQMLNLSHCSKLKVIPGKLLSSLKKLEVLYMGNSFNKWKVEESNEADGNASLEELMDLLEISSLDIHIPDYSMMPANLFLNMKLKRYKIYIGAHWEWKDHYDYSKILKLELGSSTQLTGGVSALLEGVESLYLYGPNSHESNQSYGGREFPHLRNLLVDSQATKDDASNTISGSLFYKKMVMPKLEILELSNLTKLISLIWDNQISCNSFSNLTTISVKRCGFKKLVPFHVLKSLNNMKEVEVDHCDMLETVFDLDELNNTGEILSALSVVVPLKKLTLRKLPKLKNVWSNHFDQRNVSFPSLRSMDVEQCESLTSIFPASIAKDTLRDLERLSIENCGLEVIVAKDQVSEPVAVTFEFTKLTSLRLAHLSKLRNFYPHKHKLVLSCLQKLCILLCNELVIFEKEVSRTNEEETTIDLKYPLLSYEKIIHTLEKLRLQGKQVETIGRGSFQLYHSPKLKRLSLSVEESEHFWSRPSGLGWLELSGDFGEALGGDNVAALVAPFLKLQVQFVSKLSPSIVSSPNLTHLTVKFCDGLTTLMTSSTARSLTHLIDLSVYCCDEIEQIITIQNGEDDVDKEIIFSKLEVLKFVRLPRLKRFCAHSYAFRFPLLDQLIISDCPNFTIFSPGDIYTPSLESIQLGLDWETPNEILITNLNRTLCERSFSSKKVMLDECHARMIKNDRFQSEKYPEVQILHIKKFFDEGVAFPYTLLERFQNLNELHVDNCLFEELFPSSASFDNLTMLKMSNCHQLLYLMTNSIAKRMVNLKTLAVENCEKLEEIVAEETDGSDLTPIFQKLKLFQVERCRRLVKLVPSSASFDSLTKLKVSNCHQLVYLVTNSTLKSMMNLEILEVDDCEKMKEIARYNTNEDVGGEIVFHGLRVLKLTDLPTLQTTDSRMDINTNYGATNAGCTNFSKSIFYHKVLFPKLEILKISMLRNNSITLIMDDQLYHNSFSNLEILIVYSCDFIKSVPLHVLKSLNNLKKLEVKFCDKLEKVFGYEDLNDYYKERESSVAVAPLNIKHLEVAWCNGLTTLITSTAARSLVHLTRLSIAYCIQIEEIITKEEGGDDEDKEILFTKIGILELDFLPRLKSFCGYNYSFRFPLLEQVNIQNCPQITMFCPGAFHAPILHSLRVNEAPQKDIWKTDLNNTIQHLFTFQEVITTIRSMLLNANNVTTLIDVFPEVRTLFVESFKDEGVMFPYRSLERFPELKYLYVEHSSFEEIFPSQDVFSGFERKARSLKWLYVAYLDKLKNVWKDDFQLPQIHQNLKIIEIKSCCNLTKLSPSYASFENLRELSIYGCHKLIYLVTISTAKSLVSLERLEIHDCKKMEEIVMNETTEDVEGVIAFNKLEKIKLIDMPSLKMFSQTPHTFEFPYLKEIKITGCPETKMLCPGVLKTPKLSKVKIEERDIEVEDGGDLNKVI